MSGSTLGTVLVWFRNDLRVRDHAPLLQACAYADFVVPVFCFDPRQFGRTPSGFPKTGNLRAKFLLESVSDLERSLRALGADLVLRRADPEIAIPALVEELGVDAVYYHREVAPDEREVERRLRLALTGLGVSLVEFDGHALYHPADMPFAPRDVPRVFTEFRRSVEKNATPREPLPPPRRVPALRDLDTGQLPSWADLGLPCPPQHPLATFEFQGGESAGLERLDEYFWGGNHLATYKETRDGLLGPNDSSRLSPWLANGCLSPRTVAHEVRRFEAERVANESTYWMVFELIWRDYFRWIAAKHGPALFRKAGIQGLPVRWLRDRDAFDAWRRGETGVPLVDACMRELLATGYMSNRGRQFVASFLTKNLGIDWRLGAEWFESQLIDYDVCSNWGNWNYAAGVGNDPRGFRYFDLIKQARQHDPHGEFVKHWIPGIANLPVELVHEPWTLGEARGAIHGVRPDSDYPDPIVDLAASVEDNRRRYEEARESIRKSRRRCG